MEILTALQWAKKGFIPNEGAKGTKQWTNCFYSAKAVYFKDSEVHEDKDTAKAILFAKRKEYRDVAKKRNLKMMKRCKKPFLIFIRTEIAGYDYKQSKKEVLLNN